MPSLNLNVNVWYARVFDTAPAINDWVLGKPGGAPDEIHFGALQNPKQANELEFQYQRPDVSVPTDFLTLTSRQLLLGKRVALRFPVFVSAPADPYAAAFTVVQVPDDQEQWYYVTDIYDIGRGHANEFRVALCIPWLPWWDNPPN